MISSLLGKEASLFGPRLRKLFPEARLQVVQEMFPKPKGRVHFSGPEERGQKDSLEELK